MAQNSTGIDLYLLPLNTNATTIAECNTAIATGKRVANLKSMGEIGGTDAVKEEKFLSSDDSLKMQGSTSYGNLALDALFDLDDDGQNELRLMKSTKSKRLAIIKETDGTFTKFNCLCSQTKKGYAVDEFTMFKGVLEQDGEETYIVA